MSFTASLDQIVCENRNGLLSSYSSWERVPLGEVCSILNGSPFPSDFFNGKEGVPLIRIRDVLRGETETFYNGPYDREFLISAGDLLVGMDGDFNCAFWHGPSGLLNQRVCKLTPREEFYSKRLLAFVLPGYLAAINAETSSITVKHLSSRTIEEISLPLPPREEQDRLAVFLEEKLSDLDAAVASLQRVRASLKRYRASVLKAAVEGRLVPNEAELARREGRDFEPAAVLLDRILTERRRRWEESELAVMKAAGKPPKDERWKSKYKEPVAPDASALPHLPDGWCWVTVEQLGEVSGGLTKNRTREKIATRLPYLRVANVYTNELRLDEIFDIGVESSEIPRVRLQPGDLLIVEGNGSSDQIGRVALWDGSIDPCVHQNHLIKVRFGIEMLSRWALSWLMSPAGRLLVSRAASSTSGLHTLSISKVARLSVPLAPLAEQAQALIELERRELVTDGVIEIVAKSNKRAARLRQAILKWAFEGKLVDQDPNDEPAPLLLERIRAEREVAAPSRKSRKSNTHMSEAAK